MRRRALASGAVASCLVAACVAAAPSAPVADIDADLLEVTIPQLHALYDARKYTVTQVVQWHLARIRKYNGVYRAIETVMEAEALALAARQDAEPGPPTGARHVVRCGACRSSSRPTPASPAR